ncbi:MAG TPA: DUF29 domain-containing protein [Azospirillaceae bacterium]|nr:DUF29 domain-containing protein [Azospirillaceae bacterium]
MPDSLYDIDFHAWTREQAAKLRRLAAARSNVDLDLEHLAEEVEDLGNEQRHKVESFLENVIEHLLKLEHSPADQPRGVWRRDAFKARAELLRRLTASLRNHLAATLPQRYRLARRTALLGLEQDRVDPASLPQECPYSLEQLLDPDWHPGSRHGLE